MSIFRYRIVVLERPLILCGSVAYALVRMGLKSMTLPSHATAEKLVAEAAALADKATPGPWAVTFYQEEHHLAALMIPPHRGGMMKILVDGRQQFTNPEPDAEFIAAARLLVPQLCSLVATLLAEAREREQWCVWADAMFAEYVDNDSYAGRDPDVKLIREAAARHLTRQSPGEKDKP